ncbi:MAG: hypothetical protein BGO49_07985 [Planctomycetales bacterium 71-10]|nr:MAG: hypothetical protein BGO49_07985 [Planctomycetales bacterium 71-10]
MPSPFPGMNPWLERPDVWHDFHSAYLPLLRRQLVRQVSPRYAVKIDENVYIHEEGVEARGRFRPDLGVTYRGDETSVRPTAVEIAAPVRLRLPDEDVERLPYLEIVDGRSEELITVLELLSPTNKRRGDNRTSYLNKRAAIRAGGVNLVEIDLLRGEPPMPVLGRPPCAYSVLVGRTERGPEVDFWPIGLRDPLPVIPVPLREPDADARLDLKAALDEAYDDAAYQFRIYEGPPDPPLSPEDEAWAREFLPRPS